MRPPFPCIPFVTVAQIAGHHWTVADVETPQFLSVEQLAAKFPAFTVPSLRWMLFNRETNGLSKAVVQLGRRVLIDEQAFVAWLREQRRVTSDIASLPGDVYVR